MRRARRRARASPGYICCWGDKQQTSEGRVYAIKRTAPKSLMPVQMHRFTNGSPDSTRGGLAHETGNREHMVMSLRRASIPRYLIQLAVWVAVPGRYRSHKSQTTKRSRNRRGEHLSVRHFDSSQRDIWAQIMSPLERRARGQFGQRQCEQKTGSVNCIARWPSAIKDKSSHKQTRKGHRKQTGEQQIEVEQRGASRQEKKPRRFLSFTSLPSRARLGSCCTVNATLAISPPLSNVIQGNTRAIERPFEFCQSNGSLDVCLIALENGRCDRK